MNLLKELNFFSFPQLCNICLLLWITVRMIFTKSFFLIICLNKIFASPFKEFNSVLKNSLCKKIDSVKHEFYIP